MTSIPAFLLLLILAAGPVWQTNFGQAQTEARSQHKQMLLYFSGSDWCGPCIKLKRDLFESDGFTQYTAQHLILIRADFPRAAKNQLPKEQIAHNELLAEKYNPEGVFPLTMLLDANGRVLKTWAGYPAGFTLQTLLHDLNTWRTTAD